MPIPEQWSEDNNINLRTPKWSDTSPVWNVVGFVVINNVVCPDLIVIDFSSERLIVNSDVEYQIYKGRLISYLRKCMKVTGGGCVHSATWYDMFCGCAHPVQGQWLDLFIVTTCFKPLFPSSAEDRRRRWQRTYKSSWDRSITDNFYSFTVIGHSCFLLYFIRQNILRNCHRCRWMYEVTRGNKRNCQYEFAELFQYGLERGSGNTRSRWLHQRRHV